ncbi:hypothetical protein JH395_12775 [Lactiplantibacillus plantarum]|uniref:TMhelix containing protein n=1 Tax=Lactiplantibacillus plantarum TaxID=1590 RepID=A0AAX1K8Q2_LACPN|nr:hypothetical protein [Lactiplantibacillus plantarum]QQM60587.1 hypothetical protein JH395_12775 [Lactiplantibacillus plantarum]WEZ93690.1 hypothetical protein P3T69_10805 [Lactiplantibacillus plantarum]
MSLKAKIGLTMIITMLAVGVVASFINGLLNGLMYIGTMAWVTLSVWLIEKG